MSMRPVQAAALVLYAAAALVWIYGVLDNDNVADHVGYWAAVAGTIVVYVVVAAALGRWWALVLPLVTFLLSLPAGDNPDRSGDVTWVPLYAVFFAPWAYAGILAGLLSARLARRSIPGPRA
jgi:hypothetical protein